MGRSKKNIPADISRCLLPERAEWRDAVTQPVDEIPLSPAVRSSVRAIELHAGEVIE